MYEKIFENEIFLWKIFGNEIFCVRKITNEICEWEFLSHRSSSYLFFFSLSLCLSLSISLIQGNSVYILNSAPNVTNLYVIVRKYFAFKMYMESTYAILVVRNFKYENSRRRKSSHSYFFVSTFFTYFFVRKILKENSTEGIRTVFQAYVGALILIYISL